MNDKELILGIYRRQASMVQMHVADFSEDEMLVRPAENANHAAWQIGHVTSATVQLIRAVSPEAAMPSLPGDFIERHGRNGTKLDSGFESREQLVKRFKEVNEAAIQWVQALTDEQAAKPTPERLKGFAATVGELAFMLPIHVTMHVGQIQVIRRKLGKPILF